MKTSKRNLVLFHCNATLEVLHSHLVRADRREEDGDTDFILAKPEWVHSLAVRPIWTQVLELVDSRPEYGNVKDRLKSNLANLREQVPFSDYDRVEIIVSDLQWLQNNLLVARIFEWCRPDADVFLSILDEGSVLYTGVQMSLRRRFRTLCKYLYLKINGLGGFLVTGKNIDFLHAKCKRVYCLHPEIIALPQEVSVCPIRTELLPDLYDATELATRLPESSCLYLSQPLYKLVGVDQQISVVRSLRRYAEAQGMKQFYFKPHHADLSDWTELLKKSGFHPLPVQDGIPIELLAARCNADMIAAHTTSALLNLRKYSYRGRVVCFGLDQFRSAFSDQHAFTAFRCALDLLKTTEPVELNWESTC